MLGDFLTRCLVLILGYAYPAFECFKAVEKNKVQIDQLRFWCQYWIIIAFYTAFERFGDIFISWLPMYGEMKLVLIVYLWYPKTRGTNFVYGSLLRPYVAKHETDIDRKVEELRARAVDTINRYWQYFTQHGTTTVAQLLHSLAAQSAKFTASASSAAAAAAPPPPHQSQKKEK